MKEEPLLPIVFGIIATYIFPHLVLLNQVLLAISGFVLFRYRPLPLLSGIILGLFHPFLKEFPRWEIPYCEIIRDQIEQLLFSRYNPKVASFFSTFFLGTTPTFLLQARFAAAGLNHLLSISGFHFQTLLSTVDLFLVKMQTSRLYIFLLICISSFYLFLLPLTPSVLRSFICILIALLSHLQRLVYAAKNALFAAFFFLYLFFPTKVFSPGSCLSFAATFALLYYYPIFRNFFLKNETKPSFYPQFNPFLWIKTTFRSLIALNGALSLITIPLLLLQRQPYPWSAPLFNLFIPPLFIPVFFLLLLSFFFPPAALLNQKYVETIFFLIEHPFRSWSVSLPCPDTLFPLLETVLLVAFLFPLRNSCVKTVDQV